MKSSSFKNVFPFAILLLTFVFSAHQASACGFQGIVKEKKADGTYGAAIGDAAITFVSEDGTFTKTERSTTTGRYQISLPEGRYKVTAKAAGYNNYSTGNGFFVVRCQKSGLQTGNIFMTAVKKCRVTGLAMNNNNNQGIPNAKIIFKSTTSNFVKRITAGANGRYNVFLPQGSYKVTAAAPNFQNFTATFKTSCRSPYQTYNLQLRPIQTFRVTGMVANKADYGDKIQGAIIKFTSEDGSITKKIVSGANGRYNIQLPKARYKVVVMAKGYKKYTNGKGFLAVVGKTPYQTANYFLTKE